MKRLFIFMLAIAVVFSLTACQKNSAQSPAPGSSTNASTGDSGYQGQLPLTKDKVTLTLGTHSGWSSTAIPPSNDLPVWKKFEELTNVHIDFQVTPVASYSDTMNARIAAGQALPDIFELPDGANPEKLEQDKIIIAQNNLYKSFGAYTQKLFAQTDYSVYKNMMNDASGKFYGFSNIVVPQIQTPTIILNMAWLKKLNLQVPTTTDELVNVLQAFRDDDPNGNNKKDEIPLATEGDNLFALGDPFGLQAIQLGYEFSLDSNGKVQLQRATPAYKDYLTYLNRLYSNNLLDKDFMTTDWGKIQEYASNNLVGAVIWWSQGSVGLNSVSSIANDKTGNTVVFSPIPPLKGPTGIQVVYNRLGFSGDTMLISAKSKNQELAFKWLDFIYASPQAEDTISWGIEGLTYKVEDGKKVKIIPDGESWSQKLSEIGGYQQPKAYIQYPEAIKNKQPDWFFTAMAKFDPYYKNPDIYNVNLTSAENDTASQIGGDLYTYINESFAKFVQGTQPMSSYDDYIKKLQQIGLDKYVAVFQEWYDNYKKQHS